MKYCTDNKIIWTYILSIFDLEYIKKPWLGLDIEW